MRRRALGVLLWSATCITILVLVFFYGPELALREEAIAFEPYLRGFLEAIAMLDIWIMAMAVTVWRPHAGLIRHNLERSK